MTRFPRVGDYVKFKNYVSMSIRDVYGNNGSYANFNSGTVHRILGIELHNPGHNIGYSHGVVNVVPFSLLIGVNDPSVAPHPVVLNVSYENIIHNVDFIPGDNPQAVETLYGR